MNRALFLDRDGVINEDYGYVHRINDFHFRTGIFDVCRSAQSAGMKIVVITNQSGIGRLMYTKADYNYLTEYMIDQFRLRNIVINSVYCCPYHPTAGIGHYRLNSYDRKPNPGMLVKACQDHNINPLSSIMIGDKDSDRQAASSLSILHYVDSTSKTWSQEAIMLLESL